MTAIAEISPGLGRLCQDSRGQMTIEWALVLVGVALPFYFVFRICLDLLVAHFQMLTFLQGLPFP